MVTSVHVLGSHQLGGADRFFVRLVEALNLAGHPSLAVVRKDSPVVRILSPKVEQLHLPMASKWDFYTRWRLQRLITQRRPDVVQTYMGRATRLTHVPPGNRALHVARLGGYYKIDGYYRHAHLWVGNTADICSYLVAQGLPPDRVHHVGNFVSVPRKVAAAELAALRRTLDIPDRAFVVFALGRLIAKKGFDDLLRGFARLGSTVAGRPLMLLIAGDGPDRGALAELTSSLALGERVRWAGWQDDPTPFFLLGDMFVCPSRHEPLGNVLLEAWQHRRPVLSTANEGASALIRHGANGMLAPLGDPVGLADAIRQMASMGEAERDRLADAGLATAEREHSESAVVSAYLWLYEAGRAA